jgi:cell division topological specificity factor
MWTEIKTFFGGRKGSREEAKGRLHLVLAHDRAGIEGAELQQMRREIAEVISRYVDIDPESVEIQIEQESRESSQLRVSSPLPARLPGTPRPGPA